MFDVITFGSATSDLFLKLHRSNFRIAKNKINKGRDICFSLGSKLLIEDTAVFSGGGGTNTACTFSSLGWRTAYVGKIGDDIMADIVLSDLDRFKVVSSFVKRDKQRKTASSVVLTSIRERTILIYKGASHFLTKNEIDWAKIKKTKWFYLAPLYGKTANLLPVIVKFARENRIETAFNPSREQLKMGKAKLAPVLALIDVLILNMTEASMLTGIPQTKVTEILNELRYLCPGIIVITRGIKGVLVCDGGVLFDAKTTSNMKIKEKTGAGDSFGSAFVAGLLEKNSIEYAISLAITNAESCIQEVGAKNGLLRKSKKMKMPNYKITKSNL